MPEVLTWVGDDKMMISGDMPHAEARDIIRLPRSKNVATSTRFRKKRFLARMPKGFLISKGEAE